MLQCKGTKTGSAQQEYLAEKYYISSKNILIMQQQNE